MNLKTLRAERGLTQAQAADIIGVSRVTWCSLESGDKWPQASVLAEIAIKFDVNVIITPDCEIRLTKSKPE